MNPSLPSGRTPTGSTQAATPANGSSPKSLREMFRRFSGGVAAVVGSPFAFLVSALAIVVWATLGPHYAYSDTWQLIINTGTTIITFLMVFLIQNTQNRDARAIHLKLDELIRGMKGARNKLVDLENCSEEELNELEQEFKRIREHHRNKHERSDPQKPPRDAAADFKGGRNRNDQLVEGR
jgi:low affinity Fe/Cu permease